MARTIDSPRDLLFGLMALKAGLIDDDQLAAAYVAWAVADGKSLAEILIERGELDESDLAGLATRAELRWDKTADESRLTLDTVAAEPSLAETQAATSADADLTATVGWLGEQTLPARAEETLSVGTVTSDGKRFHILRPHAKGGLGVVSVALDAELNREVALKQILDHHADKPVSRARFLLEAQITGGLEHPGIVPVYGLGRSEDGRPYYAMRFIEGDSLKEAIAAFHADPALKADPGKRSLALRKLLRRFVDVCNAIGFAHGRGVLHRDIKPANVIVGTHGETLVVDWGIAKRIGKPEIIAPAGGPNPIPAYSGNSTETLPGSTLGTPAYMSPEQAVGDLEHLAPPSDVYSLGATLYALVTGQQPFEGKDLRVLLLQVQQGAFRPPTQVDPTVDRALEAVCLKAMATKPEKRYQTARALADDIERWMADEPVTAWDEPASRRARRWARQNRPLVTAAAATLIAGVIGLGAVLAVQTRLKADIATSLERETEANKALEEANAEMARSKAAVQQRYDLAVEAIKTFHTGASEDFLLKQDQFKELRDRLLRSASDFYERLGAMLGREADPGSRRALAAANFELAELTKKVGRVEAALEAHKRVLAAREALAAEPGLDIGPKVDVGRSLTTLGGLLDETGKSEDAVSTYRRSEALLTALPAREVPVRAALAACRMRMGSLLSKIGMNDQALGVLRLARSEQEALASLPGSPAEARADLSQTTSLIGQVLKAIGKTEGAEAEFRAALAIDQQLAASPSDSADSSLRRARSHDLLGQLLFETARPDDAEKEFGSAIAILADLVAENPAVTDFRRSLAKTHNRFGWLLSRTNRMAAAENEHRAAMDIWKRLVAEHAAVAEHRNSLANCHVYLGMLMEDTGRLDDAEKEYRAAVAIQDRLVAENRPVIAYQNSLANGRFTLGILLLETGRPVEAEAEYRAAIDIQARLARENPDVSDYEFRLGSSREALGELMSRTGRPAEAEAEYGAAIAIHTRLAAEHPTVTDYSRRLARARTILGVLLSETGMMAGAEAEYRTAISIMARLAGESSNISGFANYLAIIRANLGTLLAETGRPAEAEAEFLAALATQARLVVEEPSETEYRSDLATTHAGFGRMLAESGRSPEAEAQYRAAIAILVPRAAANPALTRFSQLLAKARSRLAVLLAETGRPAEAEAEDQAAIALFGRLATAHPAFPGFREGLASGLTDLGRLSWAGGKPAGAMGAYRKALDLYESLAQPDPKLRLHLDGMARSLGLLADALRKLGQAGDAASMDARALAIRERLASDVPSVTGYGRDLAVGLGRFGMECQAGDIAAALASYRRALAILEPLPGSPGTLHAEAGCRSLISGFGSRPSSGITAEQAEAEAKAAVAALSRAIEAGYRDRDGLREDPAFDPIRDRDDFRALMRDLAFPDLPFGVEGGRDR